MPHEDERSRAGGGGPSLRDLIRDQRPAILSAWEQAVRALPAAAKLERPALVDHMPAILDRVGELADAFARGTTAVLPENVAEAHALERLDDGFDPAQVIGELAILRDCILAIWERGALPAGGLRPAIRAIDAAMTSTAERFGRARERALVALERMATETFESEGLDELLNRVLKMFIETAPVVDTATILIREGDQLRVRATLGESDSRASYTAVYGVPLIADGEAIGVAHIGSRRASEFSADDKRLFAVMATRVSAAIARQAHEDAAERAANELAVIEREQRFLARAVVALSNPNVQVALVALAEHAVSELADWCVVDLLRDDKLDRVAVVHADREKAELAREWSLRFPPEARRPTTIEHVLRTGTPLLIREVSELRLAQSHDAPEYVATVRDLGARSCIVAPLVARGKTHGTLTLVRAREQYGERELAIAVELGRRAGVVIDNARLSNDVQDAIFSRDQMLWILSHELRSPLASIELGATLMRAFASEEPRLYRHLDAVQRSAAQMESLLGNLLDTMQLQVGRFTLEKKRQEISGIIDEAIAAHEDPALRRSIRIEGDSELPGVYMMCDRARMLQALGNLIGNAIKFCKAGDVVFLKGRRIGDQIRLLVEDTGPGISDRDLPYVFDPYWSSRRHAAKGTGLGLYICKGIVEAHGGTIAVESKPGEGTTFTLALPVDEPP